MRDSSLRVSVVPSLEALLEDKSHPAMPFVKVYEATRHDPCAVLHTSGSTGTPKLVYLKHGYFTAFEAYRAVSAMNGKPTLFNKVEGRKVLSLFPPFHCAGLVYSTALPAYCNMHLVLPHPDISITTDQVASFHSSDELDGSMVPTSILIEMANTPGLADNLQKLDFVIFGGGPLPMKEGSKLCKKSHFFNNIGITEAGTFPTEITEPEDLNYFKFSPLMGAEFQEVQKGLFEMVIVRNANLEKTQPLFVTYPDLNEYHTKDVYSPHPTKPELWLYQGRGDDMLVFSNGEKLNPLPVEESITAQPLVSAALIVGQSRFQPALLVEPKSPVAYPDDRDVLLDKIWPVIQGACRTAPAHGQIAKDMILFTKPDKPFLRSAKGSVRRQVSCDLYSKEIESLYSPNIGKAAEQSTVAEAETNHTSIVRNIIQENLGADTADDQDILLVGLDSLKATNIARGISRALPNSNVQTRSVFSHPSVTALTQVVDAGEPMPNGDHDPALAMKHMLDSYASSLPINARPPQMLREGLSVILTGSTGSLGSFILRALVRQSDVERVYCLDRSENAKQMHLDQAGVDTRTAESMSNKCIWLRYDLTTPYLGLDLGVYRALLATTTHILHNAWKVDFNLPLASFEKEHISGVRRFAEFSAHSLRGASMLFVSSVGAALNRQSQGGQGVPEEPLDDWGSPADMGYAQSKFVSEQLLNRAAATCGFHATICRVGQIAGPIEGIGTWNRKEWFPAMIASSRSLHCLPGDLGPMNSLDWIPIDVCAQVLVEILTLGIASRSQKRRREEDDSPIRDSSSSSGLPEHTGHLVANGKVQTTPRDMLDRTKTYWLGTNQGLQKRAHSERGQESSSDRNAEANGTINDVQMDEAGTAILSTPCKGAEVRHIVNSKQVDWQSVLPTVASFFPPDTKVVAFREWVDALREAASQVDSEAIPAMKLLSFFEDLVAKTQIDAGARVPTFDTRKSSRDSPTLLHLKAVDASWMGGWMRQWGF